MTRSRILPQNVHVMVSRNRRLCGSPTGAFIRQSEAAYLRRFLLQGGGLCPECKKLLEKDEASA